MKGNLLMNRNIKELQTVVEQWCKNSSRAETKYGHISYWDSSEVTRMERLFSHQKGFNEDIFAWDVRSVKTMEAMFFGASSFNQDLSGWNEVKCTNI